MENLYENVEICDSYENTAQLMELFPVINPPANSPIASELKAAILAEFDLWNQGSHSLPHQKDRRSGQR